MLMLNWLKQLSHTQFFVSSILTNTTMSNRPQIRRFVKEFRFLSNFYAPASVFIEGQRFPTAEHAYQAMKTTDLDLRKKIAELPTPGQAKRFAQTIVVRPDWEDIKLQVMKKVLEEKFQNPFLGELLLATNDAELIEENAWGDRFWGTTDGTGQNHLGRLLEEVRSSLKEDKQTFWSKP